MAVTLYRSKPVVVIAHQWDGDRARLKEWLTQIGHGNPGVVRIANDGTIRLGSRGRNFYPVGAWVVSTTEGEITMLQDETFRAQYAPT